MIVVNFKTFDVDALVLGKTCEDVSKKYGAKIVACPQFADLWIARELKIPIFAQHVDAVEPGQTTGWITVESLKKAGCAGTLLNHSERNLRLGDMDSILQKCRKMELSTIACSNNVSVSSAIASLKPDFIAIEPPELIGGDVSVTTANPQIISDTVTAIKRIDPTIKVLCGAGVKKGKDVAKACALGCEGVLVASGVTKAKNPQAALEDLVTGL